MCVEKIFGSSYFVVIIVIKGDLRNAPRLEEHLRHMNTCDGGDFNEALSRHKRSVTFQLCLIS